MTMTRPLTVADLVVEQQESITAANTRLELLAKLPQDLSAKHLIRQRTCSFITEEGVVERQVWQLTLHKGTTASAFAALPALRLKRNPRPGQQEEVLPSLELAQDGDVIFPSQIGYWYHQLPDGTLLSIHGDQIVPFGYEPRTDLGLRVVRKRVHPQLRDGDLRATLKIGSAEGERISLLARDTAHEFVKEHLAKGQRCSPEASALTIWLRQRLGYDVRASLRDHATRSYDVKGEIMTYQFWIHYNGWNQDFSIDLPALYNPEGFDWSFPPYVEYVSTTPQPEEAVAGA